MPDRFHSQDPQPHQDAQDAGLPVSFLEETLAEGAPLELIQRACVMKDAPHPNAAKLFINWIFTHEGGRVYNESNLRPGRCSIRFDVSQGNRSDDIWAACRDLTVPLVDDLNPVIQNALVDSEVWLDGIYAELGIVPGG